jgi:hypothetical protein
MHTSGIDIPEEKGSENEVEEKEIPEEEMGGDLPPPINNKNNPADTLESSDDDFNRNQVTGLISLVWIILIVSIIGIIVVSTIKSKTDSADTGNYKNTPSYNLAYTVIGNIQHEDAIYKDFLTIDKTVALNEGNIIPFFTGTAENYNKSIIIPVSLSEYNSIADKTRIEFTFSRLKISGEEKLIVHDWKIAN